MSGEEKMVYRLRLVYLIGDVGHEDVLSWVAE